jgi:hypothetical protein
MQKESVLSIPSVNDKSPLLRLRVASMALAIMGMLLFIDMLAGPLRYYLSRAGLESLIYVPKAACLFFIVLGIARGRVTRALFYIFILLAFFTLVGLMHQVSISSISFSLFLILPFLFGMAAARYLHDMERVFVLLLTVILLVTALGVYLDLLMDLPWKGLAYTVNGTEIEGARAWATMGIDRPAGFTRMSTSAAFYLMCSALFLYRYSKAWWLKLLIVLTAFPAILATTNKAGLSGFVLGIASIVLASFPRILKLFVFGLTLTVMLFPVSTVILSYDLNLTDPISLLLFSSFEDRLIATWPSFIAAVSKFGNPVTGVGFGGTGSAVKYFVQGNRYILAVADNFYLYLYGFFGIAAVVLFLYLARTTVKLFASQNRFIRSLGPVMVALLAASLTTDIIEAQVTAFMLGIAVAFSPEALCRPSATKGEAA